MERTYMRVRDRNYARRRATARQQDSTKMERFEKKIVIQCIAAIVVFALLWGAKAFGGGFGEYVRNKVAYVLTYTMDFQDLYSKTLKIGKDAMGLLIEKPDDAVQQTATPPAEGSIITEPQGGDIPASAPADGSVDSATDGTTDDTATTSTDETNPVTGGDDVLLD